MAGTDPKDIFKAFAIKMGIEVDASSFEDLEEAFQKSVDRISPELLKLTEGSFLDPKAAKSDILAVMGNFKELSEVIKGSDILNDIPNMKQLLGSGNEALIGSIFDQFEKYPELMELIGDGNYSMEESLDRLIKKFPALGKAIRENDENWMKSDLERFNLVQRNQALQLQSYENLRDELIKNGQIINAPDLSGLDALDKQRVLFQELSSMKQATENVARQFESKNIGGKMESFGLTGQIAGTITQFKTLHEMSKKGLIDPAVIKNMGITGHLFRGLTAAMEETGGGMARVKAFSSTVGGGFMQMGRQMLAGISMGTLGIAAVIAALVAVVALLAKITISAIDHRESLKEVDQLYGGMGKNLMSYNDQLRSTNLAILQHGLSWEDVAKTSTAFMKSGMDATRSVGKDVVETSLLMSKAFGVSEEAMAGLIGKLMISNKISEQGIKIMGNQIAGAKQLTANLKMAPIQMDKLTDAIESSSEAFSLAKSKGEGFTKSLTNDMIGLTSLTTALGLNVGALAKKMEEAQNLITSTDSKFRNLLIISGAASVNQLMTGEINRTEAMMAATDKLQQFGRQFGGNLHLAAQMAEKVFGVSKDEALKMMNMTEQEKRKQRDLMSGIGKLTGGKLKESYDQVTGTIMESWTKFKNILMGIWMQIVSNKQLTNAFDAIGKKLTSLMNYVSSPAVQTIIGKLAEKVGNLVAKLPQFIDKIMENFGPWMDKLIAWIEDFSSGGGKSLGDKVGDWVGDFLMSMMLKILWEGLIFPFWTLPKMLAKFIFWGLKELGSLLWSGVKGIFKFFTDPVFAVDMITKISTGLWDMLKGIIEAIQNKLKFWKSGTSEPDKSRDRQTDELVKRQEEQAAEQTKLLDIKSERLNGLKDTDVIYDNGVWKYAGEKRQEIENEKIRIAEESRKHLESIDKKLGGSKEQGQQQQRQAAPQPNKGNGSPVGSGYKISTEEAMAFNG